MARWQDHVYPHGALEALAPGLWQVSGSLGKSPLPRNMVVWRSPTGGLLIHSGVCLDEEAMGELEALGEVRWIVVPCPMHRADAAPYRERYPEAQLLCPAAAREKVEEVVSVDATMEEVLPQLGVVLHVPEGLKPFELHLELPLEGGAKALVVTDALFNLGPRPPRGFGGFMLKVMGSVGPLGISRLGRFLLLKERARFKAYLERLAEIPELTVLSVAHGEAVIGDVATALKGAAQRLG